jgi:CRP/FNR family transcriptional regulator, cyclic AMP receptor protein
MISPEFLRRFPFFFGFDDVQLKALAMIADQREAAEKETIFEEGAPAHKFYLLVDGSIDLYIKSEEENNPASRRDFAVGEINPGEAFGFSTLLEPYIFSVTARSAVTSKIIEFDGANLKALIEDDKGFGYQLLLQVSRSLVERLYSTRVQLGAAWA